MRPLRRGFTLIELIVVVFLILLVYTLVFTYFQEKEEKAEPITPLTLKSTLLKTGQLYDHTTFLCIKNCQTCYLRHGINDIFKRYEGDVDLKEISAYKVDEYENLSRIEFGRYDDEEICLMLEFYPNGSSTKIILENDNGVFYLPSFFGNPQQVKSVEDAKEVWQQGTTIVSNTGDFY